MSLTVLTQGVAAGGALFAGALAAAVSPAAAMAGLGVLCIVVVWGVTVARPSLMRL
jgi:hypothetical protein